MKIRCTLSNVPKRYDERCLMFPRDTMNVVQCSQEIRWTLSNVSKRYDERCSMFLRRYVLRSWFQTRNLEVFELMVEWHHSQLFLRIGRTILSWQRCSDDQTVLSVETRPRSPCSWWEHWQNQSVEPWSWRTPSPQLQEWRFEGRVEGSSVLLNWHAENGSDNCCRFWRHSFSSSSWRFDVQKVVEWMSKWMSEWCPSECPSTQTKEVKHLRWRKYPRHQNSDWSNREMERQRPRFDWTKRRANGKLDQRNQCNGRSFAYPYPLSLFFLSLSVSVFFSLFRFFSFSVSVFFSLFRFFSPNFSFFFLFLPRLLGIPVPWMPSLINRMKQFEPPK